MRLKINWQIFLTISYILFFQVSKVYSSSISIDTNRSQINCLDTSNFSLQALLDGIMLEASKNKLSESSINSSLSSFFNYKSNNSYSIPTFTAGIKIGSFYDQVDQMLFNGNKYINNDLDINYKEFKPNISMNWIIYDYELNKSSKYFEFLAYSQLSNTKNELINQAVSASSAYLNLIRYSKDLEIVKMLQKLYERNVLVTEGLEKAGKVSRIDLNSAKASLLNYQGQEKVIQSYVDFYKNEILNTTYLKICELPNNYDLIINEFQFPSEIDLEKNISKFIQVSPEIQNLKNNISAYENLEKSYSKNYIPSLKLNIYSEADLDSGNISGYKNGEYSNNYNFYLLGSLDWDIFNGNKDKFNKESALLKKQSFENLLISKKFSLKNDIKLKINKINKLKKIYFISQDGLKILDDQVKLNNLGYINGFRTSLDLMNSTTQYFQVAEKLSSTWVELITQFINYESEMLFPSFPKINNRLKNATFNFETLNKKI